MRGVGWGLGRGRAGGVWGGGVGGGGDQPQTQSTRLCDFDLVGNMQLLHCIIVEN